jgi:hypothetical protein
LVGDFIFNLDSGESNWRGVGRTTVSRVGNYSKPRVLKESATSERCPIPSSPTSGTRRDELHTAVERRESEGACLRQAGSVVPTSTAGPRAPARSHHERLASDVVRGFPAARPNTKPPIKGDFVLVLYSYSTAKHLLEMTGGKYKANQ